MNINATLFAQAIVFAILVLFTMKFVWPPIAKALDERALKISEGLAASEKAKAELAVANKRVEEELSKSRNESATRLADAERRAQTVIEEAKARATEEAAKIVAAAHQEAHFALLCDALFAALAPGEVLAANGHATDYLRPVAYRGLGGFGPVE